MKKEVLESARFDVELKCKGVNIKAKDLSYSAAIAAVEETVMANPDAEELQTYWDQIKDSFGFMGSSGPGYSFNVSAYRPRVDLKEEKHTCPRRAEGPWYDKKMEDYWQMRGDDKCCSYCGSIHPDRVIELIKIHGFGIIGSTTKSYKRYLTRPNVPNGGFGGIKFYVQHFSESQIDEYNNLIPKS